MFSENLFVCHGSAGGHGWGLKSTLQSRQEPVGTGPRGVGEVVGSGSGAFGSQDRRVQITCDRRALVSVETLKEGFYGQMRGIKGNISLK